MTKPPTLAELQRWMMWALTDPRGATTALEDPDRADLGPRYQAPHPAVPHAIAESGDASRGARLDVYAEAYFARLSESLAEDFASVQIALGENGFAKLAADFLKQHPSRATNITEVGENLPAFVTTWLQAHEEIALAVPYLPDLAQIEWLETRAIFATTAPRFDPSLITDQNEDAWSNARFTVVPGFSLMSSKWDLQALQEATEPLTPDAVARPSHLAVTPNERGFVETHALAANEADVLRRLAQGDSLDEALSEVEDVAPEDLSTWFANWVARGFFAGVQFPKS